METDWRFHTSYFQNLKQTHLTIILLETKKSAQLSLCGKIASFKMNAHSSEDILANVRQLEQILGWVWTVIIQEKKIIYSPGSPFDL